MRVFRYFYAVVPDDALRDRVLAAARQMQLGAFLVTRPHQIHLTIRFVGEVQTEWDEPMRLTLQRACAKHAPFPLDIIGGGLFGDSTAWVGCDDREGQAAALARDLDIELATYGMPPRKHPFKAFLTIARSRGNTEYLDLDALQNTPSLGALQVHEVLLIQSRMTAFGPEYEVKARAQLSRAHPYRS